MSSAFDEATNATKALSTKPNTIDKDDASDDNKRTLSLLLFAVRSFLRPKLFVFVCVEMASAQFSNGPIEQIPKGFSLACSFHYLFSSLSLSLSLSL